jgi:hypothetical protein
MNNGLMNTIFNAESLLLGSFIGKHYDSDAVEEAALKTAFFHKSKSRYLRVQNKFEIDSK